MKPPRTIGLLAALLLMALPAQALTTITADDTRYESLTFTDDILIRDSSGLWFEDVTFLGSVTIESTTGSTIHNSRFLGSAYEVRSTARDNFCYGNEFLTTQVTEAYDTFNTWCVDGIGNDYLNGATYAGPDPGQGTCPQDEDGDGVLDEDDICPRTILYEGVPTEKLNPNHYADIDGDTIFEVTVPKGRRKVIVDSDYTLADTYGCSCEQILAIKPGKDSGELKYGCTLGTMETFVAGDGWAKKASMGAVTSSATAVAATGVGALAIALAAVPGIALYRKRKLK